MLLQKPSKPMRMERTYAGIETTTDTAVTTTIVGEETISRAAGSVVFYNLEKGNGIEYTVTEDGIPYYTSSVLYGEDEEGNALTNIVLNGEPANGDVTVKNIYTEPKGSLTVSKIWEHGYNPSPAKEATVALLKKWNHCRDSNILKYLYVRQSGFRSCLYSTGSQHTGTLRCFHWSN